MVLWTHNMSRPTFPRFFPSTKYSYWTLLQSEVKTLIQIQNNNTTWLKTIIFRHCARKFVIFWTSPNLKLDLYCAGLVLVEFDQSGTNAAATNTSISTNLDFSHNNISSSTLGSSVILCKNIIRFSHHHTISPIFENTILELVMNFAQNWPNQTHMSHSWCFQQIESLQFNSRHFNMHRILVKHQLGSVWQRWGIHVTSLAHICMDLDN